jgi:transketolase
MDYEGERMNLYYVPKEELDKIIDQTVMTDALRLNLLYMVQQAGSGHLGGSLSSLTIMVPLFFGGMGPDDVFISSKGHDAPALYAILQAKGIIPFDSIHTFRRPGGLPGHPTVDVPGVMFNTGSLGMGISKANGLAAADRLNGIKRKIHVLVGDGETREGQTYEAGTWLRPGVYIHIDSNGFGLSGATGLPAMADDFKDQIIIHDTIKGAGISFMEGNNKYHAGALSEGEYQLAVGEIRGRLPKTKVYDCAPGSYIPPFFEPFPLKSIDKIPYPRPCPVNGLLKSYSEIITGIGANKGVICMDADLEPDCGLTEFHKKYPDRFIQCGIAEQDMVSMATGLSVGGFIPIVHSFAAFLCRRANEQIYNACLERRHIVFVGHLAGLLPTGPGTSHECLEDIALMKTMPGMTVLVPETPDELKSAMLWAVNEATGPVYVSVRCWEMEGMRR